MNTRLWESRLEHRLADGKELIYEASYEGSQHLPLTLFGPLPPGAARTVLDQARWPLARRGEPKRQVLWTDKSARRFHAFVAAPDAILAAGHAGTTGEKTGFLVAIDPATGRDLWRQELPAPAVKGGLAMDHEGRIAAVLQNGEVCVFGRPGGASEGCRAAK